MLAMLAGPQEHANLISIQYIVCNVHKVIFNTLSFSNVSNVSLTPMAHQLHFLYFYSTDCM
jgi:hypothetical protein